MKSADDHLQQCDDISKLIVEMQQQPSHWLYHCGHWKTISILLKQKWHEITYNVAYSLFVSAVARFSGIESVWGEIDLGVIHSFINTEHLYSASSRELLRGAPDSSTAKKSSECLSKFIIAQECKTFKAMCWSRKRALVNCWYNSSKENSKENSKPCQGYSIGSTEVVQMQRWATVGILHTDSHCQKHDVEKLKKVRTRAIDVRNVTEYLFSTPSDMH